MADDDGSFYYAILNVSRDASFQDIKRSYRSLAQVFHPDKHTAEHAQQHAQVTFSKLQEAYEVLSDPQKRQVYDIYGKQGLVAGLEVGDKLKSSEELRKEWAEFKAKQEQLRQEALSNHKGVYLCRIDLPELLRRDSKAPIFRAVVVQNSIDAPLSDKDVLHLQGQAALRNHMGTANIIFGYKRTLSDFDTFDATAVVGLRSVLSLTSHRQLSQYSQASLTSTFSSEGMGLQLSTSRQLSETTNATLTWVVGPPSSAGMAINISRRGTKYIISGKVEVGIVTSISGRFTCVLTDSLNLRLQARLGLSGVDFEVGAVKRWSQQSTGYLGTLVGLQGVLVKLRYTRGGQAYEFPVLVSQSALDIRLVAAAYIIPPLSYVLLSRYVVRPFLRWQKKREESMATQEMNEEVKGQLRGAREEFTLLLPVACRKAKAESEKHGLIILAAWYGVLPFSIQPLLEQTVQEPGSKPEFSLQLAVAEALQYLVTDSKLVLYGNYSKSGLLGFADPAPKADKELYVGYSIGGRIFEVRVGDLDKVELPSDGIEVTDEAKLDALRSQAARYSLATSDKAVSTNAGSSQ